MSTRHPGLETLPQNSRRSGLGVSAALMLTVLVAVYLLSCSNTPSGMTTTPPGGTTPPPGSTPNNTVLTYHNDVARTGQNLNEATLTTSNVNSSSFGKLFVIAVDGHVDAQTLYLPNLTVNQATHNVLFVATEHGSVYGFDADTGTQLWQVSTLPSGETTSDDHGCGQITPEIGVTSTPAIDPKAGAHGTIYVVAMSKDGSGNYHQRLHALDVTTGAEEFGGPKEIQASYPGTGANSSGGNVVFDPGQYAERAGLLLLNGTAYLAWTSHCDGGPYTGWIMGYDQNTLAQVAVLNVTPNGSRGAIWMAGAGPAADVNGNIFLLDANGIFDSTLNGKGFPNQGDFGNAFLKISTANQKLAVADYFEMSNQQSENDSDVDLGSGGALVLPDLTDGSGNTTPLDGRRGQGRESLCRRSRHMGRFNSSANNIYQAVTRACSAEGSGACPLISTTPSTTDRRATTSWRFPSAAPSCRPAPLRRLATLRLSGRHSGRLCQRKQQRHCLGGGERQPCRSPRL